MEENELKEESINQMGPETHIFKSTGQYLGFIKNGTLYSRDGNYLGWSEGKYIWDASGNFRGELTERNNNFYILKNILAVPPIPKSPKSGALAPTIPNPRPNISPIPLQIHLKDGF